MSQQLQELIHRSSHIAFYSGVSAERQRIIRIYNVETGHIGKTHYEGIECGHCDFIEKVLEDTEIND